MPHGRPRSNRGAVTRRAPNSVHEQNLNRRMTLAGPGTFAMLVHEGGSAEDCRFAPIAPVVLDLPPDLPVFARADELGTGR